MIWNKEYIYNTGFLNGYPKCCIDAYYEDLRKYRSPASLRKIDRSGYIPCQKHFLEYKEKMRCLKELCKQKEGKKQKSHDLFGLYITNISHRLKQVSVLKKANTIDDRLEPGLLEHFMG